MSDCRSFGSDYHPSSQSRKISIGILVDSSRRKSQAAKENEAVVLNAERTNSKKENSVDGKYKGEAVIDGNTGMQNETPEQVNSQWINTRPPNTENIDIETSFCSHRTSKFPANSGRGNKLGRLKDVSVTHSVHYFPNPTSILQSEDGKKKDFVGFTYKRKGGKVENSQKEQEFTFGTPQEVLVLDKEAKEDKNGDRRTETLRLKLQEILGTISSPKSQPFHPQYQELVANNLVAEQVPNQKGNGAVRQNSDTIETDSERPVHTMKRPFTRSLTRKRVSTKMQLEKPKRAPPSSSYRRKQQKNIFSFQEGLFGKDDAAVNDGSSLPTRKRSEKKNSGIEPRKKCFSKNGNADEILQATHRSETLLPTERTSSVNNKIGSRHGCPSQNKLDSIEQDRKQQKDSPLSPEVNSHFSPDADSHKSLGEHCHQSSRNTYHQSSQACRTDQQQHFNTPASPENGDPQEEFGYPTVNNLDKQENFQSPMFKIDTPVFSSSPSLMPKTDQVEQGRGSELAEITFTVGNISSFSILQFSKADRCPSSADTKLSAEEMKNSPCRKHSPVKTKNVAEDGLSESSSKDGDSDGSEEGSPTFNGLREGDTFSPEAATPERSNFTLNPTKRLRSHEGHVFSKFSPTSPSPKGISASDWNPEPSEQHHEDELERVTMLFALAIEKFKKKLKLATRKKSSEILVTISDDINLQLQNIKSQIQRDLGKLTSDSKSKRKRMETRFQEQEEQLRLINDKFKQDIYQHLQDCKGTLDGLELHQNELKGTLKKQKASHHKLLIQVEEAIEAKLTDAQRRITAVNKLAKEKMLQLRHVVAECLH